jgi:Zn-dependent protease
MKSLFKIEFEENTYELLGNQLGKEVLLKNGQPFLEQRNLKSSGSYTFKEPMNGMVTLDYLINFEGRSIDITISQLGTELAVYQEPLDPLLPAFLQDSQAKKPEASRRQRFQRSITSIVVGFIIWSLLFGSNFATVLVVVLLIHELGHFLAMKAFGYTNLNIIFTPPFGAVATGTKENPSAAQEIIVLFAGPIPGIILGYLLFYSGFVVVSEAFTTQLITFILFINYLNLVPIAPLDGGRIFNLVFISRYPKIQWAIASLGILYFLYEGFITGSLFSFIFAGIFGLVLWGSIQNRNQEETITPPSDVRLIAGIIYLISVASAYFFIVDIWF